MRSGTVGSTSLSFEELSMANVSPCHWRRGLKGLETSAQIDLIQLGSYTNPGTILLMRSISVHLHIAVEKW